MTPYPNYMPNYQASPNYYPTYNPSMGQNQVIPNTSVSVAWVNNRQEAENYIVGINNAVTLWDKDGKHVYVKKTDASGRPEFHAYALEEEGVESQPQVETVSKDDISAITSALEEIKEDLSKFKNLTDKKFKTLNASLMKE